MMIRLLMTIHHHVVEHHETNSRMMIRLLMTIHHHVVEHHETNSRIMIRRAIKLVVPYCLRVKNLATHLLCLGPIAFVTSTEVGARLHNETRSNR
jgi:hypothetical protein